MVPSAAEQGWYVQIAAELTTPADRLLVDVGCGQAPMAIQLALAQPDPARILALDSDPDALANAAAVVDRAHLRDRITMVEHDLTDGVDAVRGQLAGADLIWACASLHHVGDQQTVITELAGLLAAGGRLALAEGGLAERFLPWDLGVGAPGLELRLDAARDRWFARMRVELPGSVPMPYGWPIALRNAGLREIVTATRVLEEPTPLVPATLEKVLNDLAHRVSKFGSDGLLDGSDIAAWDRLLDRGDPAWLGHRADLYSLSARTLYIGQRGA